MGRPKAELVLSEEEQAQLQSIARSRSLPADRGFSRSRAAAEATNATVGKWRRRFVARRILAVRVGRQIGTQQPDQCEGHEHPAIGTVFALTGAEISATEERYPRHHKGCDRKGNSGPVSEERGEPAPAEDGEAEICKGPHGSKGR
jgi:hypothetical protein